MRLVVVSGPPGSGKIAAMWAEAAADPELHIVHRDQVRVLPGRLVSEAHLTVLVASMVRTLLDLGYSVVTAAQNLADEDRALWGQVALDAGVPLEVLACSVSAGGRYTVRRLHPAPFDETTSLPWE